MGILNVTPDSFFDGGCYSRKETAVAHGIRLASEGADILDVGGESTRPGAEPVSLEAELERVIPVVEALKSETDLPVSVDTFKSEVAAAAIAAGADIINDISFGTFDRRMFSVVAKRKCAYVGMHIQGTPRNMQKNPSYQNVVLEVSRFLKAQATAAENAGIPAEKIAVDPGIGFGKNDRHNLSLLKELNQLEKIGYPLLLGISRKSLMGRLLGLDVEERLAPSLAAALFCMEKGVSIVRVHDVFETKQALLMWNLLSE
ncbi:MAG: dihydropteroate synthase [Acidobacteria bacterium]|nr:dihydropteroate synthase [Acidobacteriota bacterium]